MAIPQTVPIRRLTMDDVWAMVEAGVLKETDRVELEGGVLVEMEPSGGTHDNRITRVARHFMRELGDAFDVRIQMTFLTPEGGYYEPDVMVIAAIGDELPTTAALVVEVSITSQSRDREKAATYAAAGVQEYWIVDVPGGEVVVHRDPRPDGYGLVQRLGRTAELTPLVPAPPLAVSALVDA